MTDYKHDFEVGEGVHYTFNGDSWPARVVRVTPTKVVVQDCDFQVKHPSNKEGHRDCEFFDNPANERKEFTYQRGRMMNKGGGPFVLCHGLAFGRNPHV